VPQPGNAALQAVPADPNMGNYVTVGGFPFALRLATARDLVAAAISEPCFPQVTAYLVTLDAAANLAWPPACPVSSPPAGYA
jgi:hypothetical protein